MVVRHLIAELLEKDKVKFKSEIIDYTNGDRYILQISLRKQSSNPPISNCYCKVQYNSDDESEMYKLLKNQFDEDKK